VQLWLAQWTELATGPGVDLVVCMERKHKYKHIAVSFHRISILPSITSPAVGNSRPKPDLYPSPDAIGAHSFLILPPAPIPAPIDGPASWPRLKDPNPSVVGFGDSVSSTGFREDNAVCSVDGDRPGDGLAAGLAQPTVGTLDKAPVVGLELMTEVNLALVSLWDEVDDGFGDIDGRTDEEKTRFIHLSTGKKINKPELRTY